MKSVLTVMGALSLWMIVGAGQMAGAQIDLLFGEAGNDTLEGGEDIAVLLGGPGNDTCTGGTGEQDFVDECEVIDEVP